VISRTSNVLEYYVAGRRVPAMFNGMATAADWISAASFISLAGGLYLHGFDGLAYIMGWTGGYCLVALLIAPYLRKFASTPFPTFWPSATAARPTRWRRRGAHPGRDRHHHRLLHLCGGADLCGGPDRLALHRRRFSVGIFLGLASILVCSFLGGMRAITWTQVAQYIIILVAFLIPAMWLSAKHSDNPIPQVAYGKLLPKQRARARAAGRSERSRSARHLPPARRRLRAAPARPAGLVGSRPHRPPAQARQRQTRNASLLEIRSAERELVAYPKAPTTPSAPGAKRANNTCSAPSRSPHATPYPGDKETSDIKRNNFLALVFCLMLGTAALPHILMRSYTTPSVHDAPRCSGPCSSSC
jgi:cation/acetate symporter